MTRPSDGECAMGSYSERIAFRESCMVTTRDDGSITAIVIPNLEFPKNVTVIMKSNSLFSNLTYIAERVKIITKAVGEKSHSASIRQIKRRLCLILLRAETKAEHTHARTKELQLQG